MLTIKKRFEKKLIFFLTLTALFAGCAPPGPGNLRKGARLLEQGRVPEAIEQLRIATSVLNTNADAWNYLGLAYQQAGQASNAATAYQKALTCNHDLVEVHYNLGCLWLDQNRPDLAKTEFTAYTLRRDKSPDGWLKLGTAQSRLAHGAERADERGRELAAAEKSFAEALKFDPQSAEAWNGLGLVQLQRNRAHDAAQSFSAALKHQAEYRPALLNLAVVLQTGLNDRAAALEKYRAYLALQPRAANWAAVNATATALDQELNGAPRPAMTNVPAPPVVSNPPKPVSNVVAHTAVVARAEPAPVVVKTSPPAVAPATNVQVVKLGPEAAVRPAQDVPAPPPATSPAAMRTNAPVANSTEPAKTEKGFLQRINPANLFRGNGSTQAQASAADTAKFPRYSYRSPAKPADGDRGAAEKMFAQGVQDQRANRLTEAIQKYQQATQSDPGYYDAYHNLGLAHAQAGNLPPALAAFETALAIRPDALDARYNFALALKQANYPLDAAAELEKILAAYPKDARAHLALANLYAQQLRQPAKAREHYLKVLELNPDNPQAGAIHEWLWQNRR